MQLLSKSYFRLSLFKYLLLASVNENHEMYMKDSVSAAEVGTGQYATTKGISQTNLITTVTPEKKAEEEKDDEEGKKRAEEVTPISAVRHDTKVEFWGFCIKLTCLESSWRNTELWGRDGGHT